MKQHTRYDENILKYSCPYPNKETHPQQKEIPQNPLTLSALVIPKPRLKMKIKQNQQQNTPSTRKQRQKTEVENKMVTAQYLVNFTSHRRIPCQYNLKPANDNTKYNNGYY